EIGVKYLTLYAFSVENWKRPETEVKELFNLLDNYLEKEKERIEEEQIRFRTIGRLNDLPKKTKKNLEDVQNKTINHKGLTLTFALSYGGRAEICDAISKMVGKAKMGEFNSEVNEEIVRKYLYAPDLPDPDLLIRTSGEYRISNFLLWQIAYTEIIILDVLWPDFKQEHFYEAVLDYQRRERRYGGVSE
ncbi:MAG: polyprenyl diphosphate synthase, partial [Acidobacteria bacterium]|nr:polyprenyl diphosphate synthase [Acidobacteriota bacterium]